MSTFLQSSPNRSSRALRCSPSQALGRALVAALAVIFLGSCSGWGEGTAAKRPALPILTAGYFHGPVGFELLFYSDGEVLYRRGDVRGITIRLDERDRERLEDFWDSDTFSAALADLRQKGYSPGCCDEREVTITYKGSSVGYPVCDEVPVSESVLALVNIINEVSRAKLGSRYSEMLPSKTCRARGD